MALDLDAVPATVGALDTPPDHAVVRAALVVDPVDGPFTDTPEAPASRIACSEFAIR